MSEIDRYLITKVSDPMRFEVGARLKIIRQVRKPDPRAPGYIVHTPNENRVGTSRFLSSKEVQLEKD